MGCGQTTGWQQQQIQHKKQYKLLNIQLKIKLITNSHQQSQCVFM